LAESRLGFGQRLSFDKVSVGRLSSVANVGRFRDVHRQLFPSVEAVLLLSLDLERLSFDLVESFDNFLLVGRANELGEVLADARCSESREEMEARADAVVTCNTTVAVLGNDVELDR